MKNIFGLNKTLYGETGVEEFDGACFITKSLESEAEVEEAEQSEETTEEAEPTKEKSKLFKYFFLKILYI